MTQDDFMTYLTSAALAVMLTLLAGNGALAAELRLSIEVDAGVVRLGDIFDDAGAAAQVIVADAPAPGTKSRIALTSLVPVTAREGIGWRAPRGVTHISVTRRGQSVGSSELRQLVSEQLKRDGYASSFDINLLGQSRPVLLPLASDPGDIGVAITSFDAASGRFGARLAVPIGGAAVRHIDLRGRIEETVYVPGLGSQVAPGEVIGEEDIAWVRLPKRRLGKHIIRSKQALVGMSPRRPLAQDRPVRMGDVQKPLMVKKGSQVAITYRTGNLMIASNGRALENGSRGDVVRILNTRSHQTLEGVVVGPDRVELRAPGQVALFGG